MGLITDLLRPIGDRTKPLRLLLIDSWYSTFRGVILLVRLFDGTVRAGDHIRSFVTGIKYIVGEVGIMVGQNSDSGTPRSACS